MHVILRNKRKCANTDGFFFHPLIKLTIRLKKKTDCIHWRMDILYNKD